MVGTFFSIRVVMRKQSRLTTDIWQCVRFSCAVLSSLGDSGPASFFSFGRKGGAKLSVELLPNGKGLRRSEVERSPALEKTGVASSFPFSNLKAYWQYFRGER
jgi:hypothetical protein